MTVLKLNHLNKMALDLDRAGKWPALDRLRRVLKEQDLDDPDNRDLDMLFVWTARVFPPQDGDLLVMYGAWLTAFAQPLVKAISKPWPRLD